jgi:hypothetical protein
LALDAGEWSVSYPGCALPLGQGPPVLIVQEAGWAPELVGSQRLEEKNLLPVPGIKLPLPGHPVHSQTLYSLSYTSFHK